jgi:hypothetical protein
MDLPTFLMLWSLFNTVLSLVALSFSVMTFGRKS